MLENQAYMSNNTSKAPQSYEKYRYVVLLLTIFITFLSGSGL